MIIIPVRGELLSGLPPSFEVKTYECNRNCIGATRARLQPPCSLLRCMSTSELELPAHCGSSLAASCTGDAVGGSAIFFCIREPH